MNFNAEQARQREGWETETAGRIRIKLCNTNESKSRNRLALRLKMTGAKHEFVCSGTTCGAHVCGTGLENVWKRTSADSDSLHLVVIDLFVLLLQLLDEFLLPTLELPDHRQQRARHVVPNLTSKNAMFKRM